MKDIRQQQQQQQEDNSTSGKSFYFIFFQSFKNQPIIFNCNHQKNIKLCNQKNQIKNVKYLPKI